MGRGETNIMPGNARKLALASFNIRFILFRAAGRISSSASSSLSLSRQDLSSRSGTKDREARDRGREKGHRDGAGREKRQIEQPIS